jgi:hypothetical protein
MAYESFVTEGFEAVIDRLGGGVHREERSGDRAFLPGALGMHSCFCASSWLIALAVKG